MDSFKTCIFFKKHHFHSPGALLGVVGGSGVLKGSKGAGSNWKGVVPEEGLGVMEVVLERLKYSKKISDWATKKWSKIGT